MDRVKNTMEGVKNGWLNLDKKKRITMVSVIIGVLVLVSLFTYRINKVDCALLFGELELDDAGVIVNDLEAKKIKYKLENSGKNIYIDRSLIDSYRVQLAVGGMIPENSTGFEIFDDMGMMVTDEDRHVMYQRALTGELQRSIMSFEGVSSAKVHLVMPKKSIFETEAKKATASVVIGLKPDRKITNESIRGIASLVSGAVDNMPIENVRVIDTNGVLLSGFLQQDGQTSLDMITQNQQIQGQFEEKIENSIYELLGSAFGWDKVRVKVLADMDFDAEESTIIAYSDPVIRSEQIDASGGEIDIQQVTGGSIDDNISNVVDSVTGDGSTYSRTTNHEITTETRTVIKAPGKVNKLTTSVLVDGDLSDTNLLKIMRLVEGVTGYDATRGDIINIEAMKFNTDELLQPEVAEEPGIFGPYTNYIFMGLRIAGGLAALILLILGIRNMRKKRKEEKRFQEELAVGSMIKQAGTTSDVIDDTLEVEPDSKGSKAQKYASDNPELAADLIKAWMKDMG